VERHGWAHDLVDQYMTATYVTIETDAGVSGTGCATTFTGYDFDRVLLETLRTMLPQLIGQNPLHREHLWTMLHARTLPRAYGAQSAVDMALWDLLGKRAGLPLYQLLGGVRGRVPTYASTPMLPDIPAYLRLVEDLLVQGFRAVKFHAWGIIERDLALCRAARQQWPAGVAFMLDGENNYDRRGALRAVDELAALDFTWLEAPLSDFDGEGYRDLVRRGTLTIVPAGNWIIELPQVADMLATRTWSAARIDAGTCGGLTPARKVAALAEAAGTTCEVQCWAYALQQAADLHLIAALPNCTYFEQPIPYPAFEYGVGNPLRTEHDGCVPVPQGAGLGIDLDWGALDAATIARLDIA
jgi:L-alanine-DL-glutamate epimerase-like enolase superfamily enzyme